MALALTPEIHLGTLVMLKRVLDLGGPAMSVCPGIGFAEVELPGLKWGESQASQGELDTHPSPCC